MQRDRHRAPKDTGQQETKFTCSCSPREQNEFRGAVNLDAAFPDQSGEGWYWKTRGNPQLTPQRSHREQMSLCTVQHASQGVCFNCTLMNISMEPSFLPLPVCDIIQIPNEHFA